MKFLDKILIKNVENFLGMPKNQTTFSNGVFWTQRDNNGYLKSTTSPFFNGLENENWLVMINDMFTVKKINKGILVSFVS